eukprot:scaffold36512_cov59-Attheya_sp.AAC.7
MGKEGEDELSTTNNGLVGHQTASVVTVVFYGVQESPKGSAATAMKKSPSVWEGEERRPSPCISSHECWGVVPSLQHALSYYQHMATSQLLGRTPHRATACHQDQLSTQQFNLNLATMTYPHFTEEGLEERSHDLVGKFYTLFYRRRDSSHLSPASGNDSCHPSHHNPFHKNDGLKQQTRPDHPSLPMIPGPHPSFTKPNCAKQN